MRRSPTTIALLLNKEIDANDVKSALHALPISYCDEGFFNSHDPKEDKGRASSCEDISKGDFEGTKENMGLHVNLNDLLPWPLEFQFQPQFLHERRKREKAG
jgi:hypothetical protein